ncbi:hypothetical protein [Paraburkholderia fungorum]|uniref:Uncharacterized protein n=1 Tax=Paraburkholderia fungorum TaxID=134537 RepID=A0A3R7EUM8_9BURK|nr:hypothetical protein [Paraburkholderia fungorum]RKF48611.1 hypothetical protein BCY88_20765 [Paraburkholderia fungorum]
MSACDSGRNVDVLINSPDIYYRLKHPLMRTAERGEYANQPALRGMATFVSSPRYLPGHKTVRVACYDRIHSGWVKMTGRPVMLRARVECDDGSRARQSFDWHQTNAGT